MLLLRHDFCGSILSILGYCGGSHLLVGCVCAPRVGVASYYSGVLALVLLLSVTFAVVLLLSVVLAVLLYCVRGAGLGSRRPRRGAHPAALLVLARSLSRRGRLLAMLHLVGDFASSWRPSRRGALRVF